MASISDRICLHMNNDHAASVLAITWYHGNQPSAVDSTMTSIDASGMDIDCIVDGVQVPLRVKFFPKIDDESQFRKRLIIMHEEALSPRVRMLVTPLASIPLFLICLLALVVCFPDLNSFTILINQLAVKYFASLSLHVLLLMVCFIHISEALIASKFAYDLKLNSSLCFGWFLLTLFGGNGTLSVIQAACMHARNNTMKKRS